MIYKITIKNQFKALQLLIYGIIMGLAFMYFLFYFNKIDVNGVWIFLSYYFLLFVPALYLHLEYYFTNRSDEIVLDSTRNTLKQNNEIEIAYADIKSITYFMPPVWYRNGFISSPFEDYHFAIITLNSGQEIIFTCLMATNVKATLSLISGPVVIKRKLLFASIKFAKTFMQ
jgi:hypothetical protein